MKLNKTISTRITFVLFILANYSAFSQCGFKVSYPIFLPTYQEITLDNELEPGSQTSDEHIYCNPLVLDGELLNYETFGLQSTGTLMLMAENPISSEAIPIPFTILLRRKGTIMNETSMHFMNEEMLAIEISRVLQLAKPGDHLIINPVNGKYWKAKRILKLIKREGC